MLLDLYIISRARTHFFINTCIFKSNKYYDNMTIKNQILINQYNTGIRFKTYWIVYFGVSFICCRWSYDLCEIIII